VSQTDTDTSNASTPAEEERIRKIYARDLKVGDSAHTVFRATRKDTHTSRAGKKFLAVTLVDRTGEVDARIFDNVEIADAAFADDDYLLVQGKVGTFHGKPQLVIERLERLDPEPMDPKEFTWVAPVAPAAAPAPAPAPTAAAAPAHPAEEKPEKPRKADEVVRELKLPRRVRQMLEQPQVAQAVDALLAYVERLVDERVAARLGQSAPEKPEPRPEKKPRAPRVEHRAWEHRAPEHKPEPKKSEPRRDPSLPEGLAFKPFKELVGEDKPAAAEAAPAPEPASAPPADAPAAVSAEPQAASPSPEPSQP
jgi:hypothetical protein